MCCAIDMYLPLYNLTLGDTFANICQQKGLDQAEIHGRVVE